MQEKIFPMYFEGDFVSSEDTFRMLAFDRKISVDFYNPLNLFIRKKRSLAI